MTWWKVALVVWALVVVAGLAWLAWSQRHARCDVEIWDGGDTQPGPPPD